MARPIITAQRLREVLHYDPLTGVFTRRVVCGGAKVGDVAGGQNSAGYTRVCVDGRQYRAHRLAWLYMTGEWPPHQIDHENTNRDDNLWKNIRQATNAQNQQNRRKAHSNSVSGFLGVSPHGERWQAAIRVDRKQQYIGLFDTPELGHIAYLEAKAKLHPFQTLVETQS